MVNDKLAPDIRFNGFADNWTSHQLSDLMDFANGINAPKEQYGKGRKMISVLDILSHGALRYDDIVSSVEIDAQTESSKKVERGDLVFVRSSEVVTEVGWAKAYLDENYSLFSGFSIRGKKKSAFNSRFVELALNSANRTQIELKSGGSTRFNVSQSILSEVELLIPHLDEQDYLSAFFDHLDNAITLSKKQYSETTNIKKALLIKMFPKKGADVPDIRFDGFNESWKTNKLGDCFAERTERSAIGELISVTQNNGVVKANSLVRRDNSSEDKSNYKVVRVGDIAYNSMRMWQGASGYSSYDGIVSPAYTVISPKQGVHSPFFAYIFKLPNMILAFERSSQGLTSDTWNLKFPAFSQINVLFPEIAEQKAIANFFINLDNLITAQQEELEKLQNIKKACLSKMFV